MKKSLNLLLAIALVFTMFSSMAFAANGNSSIGQKLQDAGVITGDLSGNLNEGEAWTRQDATVILARLLDAEDEAKATAKNHGFTDVTDPFYDGFITWASENGYFQGHSATRFGYNESITNKQFAVVMLRALGVDFDDDWYAGDIEAKAIEFGIFPEGTDWSDDAKPSRGDLFPAIAETIQIPRADGTTIAEERGWEDFITEVTVTGVEVIDASTISVTFSNGDVVEYDVDPALEPNVETTVTVTHNDKEYEVTVTHVVENAEVHAVYADNLKQVTVQFSAAVEKASAENKGNYTIDSIEFENAVLSEDGKTVTLTLKNDNGVVFTNQKEYKITVNGVIGANGNAVPKADKVAFTPVDTTLPAVASVEALGTKALKVTFSEPVVSGSAATTNNYKIDGKSIAGSVKYNYPNSVIISTTMTTGEHTLDVSNVADFANFKVSAANIPFVVAEDTSAPEVVSVTSEDLTKVVVEFNEPIKAVTKAYHSGTKTANTPIQINDNKVTLIFSDANRLNVTDTVITLENVEDYSGNKANREVTVNPVLDTVRPVVTGVKTEVVSGNHKITVTFSKAVNSDSVDVASARNGANYTIKDKDGKVVTGKGLDHKGNPVVDVNMSSDNKEASFTLVGKLDAGSYIIEVSGIKDRAYVSNIMLPYSQTFTVGDTSAPSISKAWFERTTITGTPTKYDTVLYVQFSEDMAVDGDGNVQVLTKYNYATDYDPTTENGTWTPFPTGTAIESITGDTIKITMPRSETALTIDGIRVTLVSDVAGNFAGTDYIVTKAVSNTIGTITVNKAVATAKNTLSVEFQGVLTNIDANDFSLHTVTDNTYRDLILSSYSVSGGKTTVIFNLATSDELNARADLDKVSRLIVTRSQDDVATQDAFGAKVNASTIVALTDNIRPGTEKISGQQFTLKQVGGNWILTVQFEEQLSALHTAAVDVLQVKAKGNVLQIDDVQLGTDTRQLEIDLGTDLRKASDLAVIGALADTDIVEVHVKAANNDLKFIKDLAGNAVQQVSLSDVYQNVD